MAANDTPPQQLNIVDNLEAREVYSNKFIGSAFDGGSIVLTFGCMRLVPARTDSLPRQGKPPDVYVTTRLALSPAAAVELVNGLNNILATVAQKSGSGVALPTAGLKK